MHGLPSTHRSKSRHALKIFVKVFVCGLLVIGCTANGISPMGLRPGQAQLPAGLEPLIRTYPPPTEKILKALKKGIDEFANGQYAAALGFLAEAESGNASQLGDYVFLYRANANLLLNRAEQASELFHLLETTYPDSSLIQEAILGECKSLLSLHHPAAALASLENPRLDESAESLECRARALEDSGKREEALSRYLGIMAKYVNSSAAAQIEKRLAAISPRYWARPANYKTLLERAENLLRSGKNREARALLVRLAPVPPPDATASAKRRVLFAQAEYDLGKATTVLPAVKNITASMPDLHARALYLEAASYRRLDREGSFFERRDKALELYPRSPYTERILYSVATYFEVNSRLEEAAEAYRILTDRFPKGEYVDRAAMRFATLAYGLKRYEDALRGFYACFTSGSGIHMPVTLYWMGRCCHRLGDTARATELFRWAHALAGNSYYGGRALAAEMTLKQPAAVQARPSAAIDLEEIRRRVWTQHPPNFAISPPSAAATQIIERARQLASAGLPDLALTELRRAVRRFPEDRALRYLMSRIYETKGDWFGVISTLRRALPDYDTRSTDAIPREVWALLFPVRHHDEIVTQARKYGLDPNLVLALIRQESAFAVDAHSHANARGLMQVLPSTGRKLAREAGVARYSTQKLFRPDVNIALGTRYLAALLQHFDGKVELALAAYNAGTDRADRWMREFGDVDMPEFVEFVPFSETRDYVKQVLTNVAFYRMLTAPSTGAAE